MSNSAPNLIAPEFLDDLRATFQRLSQPVEVAQVHDFNALETRLLQARVESIERSVRAHADYRHRHPDSPLFESVTLFEPMGFERLESALTRTLAWLLDPGKPHGFGNSFLSAMLDIVPVEPVGMGEHESTRIPLVMSEWQINKACRIDIAIADPTRKWVVLIEAKIQAHERTGQLDDYYRAAKAAGYTDIRGIYLTTQRSRKTTDALGKWHQVLYDEVAGELLKLLEANANGGDGVHPLARYFVAGLLRDICGWHTGSDAHSLLRSVNCFEFEQFSESYFK